MNLRNRFFAERFVLIEKDSGLIKAVTITPSDAEGLIAGVELRMKEAGVAGTVHRR